MGSTTAYKNDVLSANEAVYKMVLWSLNKLNIRGGNMFVKRAIKHTQATSIAVLSGDCKFPMIMGFIYKTVL